MVDAPTASLQERSGYVGSFPSATTNYSASIYGYQTEAPKLRDNNMTDYNVGVADTKTFFNSSESRPSFGSSTTIHAPNTAITSTPEAALFSTFTTQIQPTFHSTPENSPFYSSSSSQPSFNSTTTNASPFAMFNSSNETIFNAAPTMPAMRALPPSPFAMQPPTESTPKFNPFAAQTINQGAITSNPFAAHAEPEKKLGLYPGQVQKVTGNGSSVRESKSAFSQTPPTTINSASNPFHKDMVAENKPLPGDVTDKSASRQTRFSESTDIGTLYQQV
jgi:hypothetical protein